jgi:cardiolipin synthase (CMP-forming)
MFLENRSLLNTLMAQGLTLATGLTLLRVMITPVLVLALLYQAWLLALCLFLAAAMTDFLDGACARLFDEQTLLGAYLDPIADKLLIISCYTTLACIEYTLVPLWLVVVMMIKEAALVGGTLWLSWIQGNGVVQPAWTGKAAMLVQTAGVFWILLILLTGRLPKTSLSLLHWVVLCFVVVSFLHYLYQALQGTRLWYLVKKSLCFYA